MSKTDLRIVKTQKAIKESFKVLVCQEGITKITVKELAAKAKIHRKTFYLHYANLDALYEEVVQELAQAYYAEIDRLPVGADFTEVNRVFFEFVCQQDKYAEKLLCDPGYRQFADQLFTMTLSHNRQRHNPYQKYRTLEQNIINNFLALTSLNLYRQWVKDGKQLAVEDLIALSGQLFTQGISSLNLV
ncbi:TetR family transcriptional regulator [Ligilactobacillus equi]|nr:TetR family transcriptional regulator [Ligilactobacillus equi]MCQ2557313.1 TetR family transcriptional regulator [Ligilactobacillus sp.]